MNIKNILLISAALVGSFAITGCGGPSERELQCMELTGDRLCRNEYEQQADADRRGMRRNEYGAAGPGEYHNYYGSPQHGSWGNDGRYSFNDPMGAQASQTNAFLLGAGLGGLGAYALTRNQFNKQNPKGWSDTKRTNTKYVAKDGKEISKSEFNKRDAQSKKAKAANAASLKKQADNNTAKSKVKPTAAQNNDLKSKLKAKQAARKADRAAGKQTTGSKLKSNERKVKQQRPQQQKQQRAQKSTYKQQKSSSRSRSTPPRSSSRTRK